MKKDIEQTILFDQIKQITNKIKEKINVFYRQGNNYQVSLNDNNILIKGQGQILSEAYYYQVPGELSLAFEEAKDFLDSLDKATIINNYLGESDISFRINNGNRIVFAKDKKEISNKDINNLYQDLEEKKVKSTLPLELNMIKAKSLYAKYEDLYEQAVKKRAFLELYNDSISSPKERLEAIKFAKKNQWAQISLREYSPSRYFDIAGNEDLVDTIINGESVSFDSISIPLEKRKKYLSNLDNYELRINNLVERLEKELEKIEIYNEKTNLLLQRIAKSNVLNVEPISKSELPNYDCVSLDTILTEEKQKYNEEIKERKAASLETVTKNKYPWLEDIDKKQRSSISSSEKTALMLYKSFMYNLFNKMISYARSQNLKLNELDNDEFVEMIMREEYKKYYQKVEAMHPTELVKSESLTVVDDLFPDDHIVEYDTFRQIALDNVILLEPALSKNTLEEPLTVYRCVYEPDGSNIYKGDLGNALLSTTTSVRFVSDFLANRENDINQQARKVIYEIELPAGSPIIAYTDDVFLKNGNQNASFAEEQKEILIDSKNYEFVPIRENENDINRLEDNTNLYTVKLKAIPKTKENQELERPKTL